MRTTFGVAALTAAVGIGFAAGRVRPAAAAADEHAGHEMEATTTATAAPGTPATQGTTQGAAIPASGAAAPDRIAKSPRHAEWVAIRVNATDSVMAWVVYPERR